MDDRKLAIIDSSTLINFLAVDRADLLEHNRRYRFLITEHVRSEISDAYPEQLARLASLLDRNIIEESPVTALNELEVFAGLAASNRLGQGECASIAAASERGLVLAIDDKRAKREASALNPHLVIVNTQSLMVELIWDGIIDVPSADAIKKSWEKEHRFRLPFTSFADLVSP